MSEEELAYRQRRLGEDIDSLRRQVREAHPGCGFVFTFVLISILSGVFAYNHITLKRRVDQLEQRLAEHEKHQER